LLQPRRDPPRRVTLVYLVVAAAFAWGGRASFAQVREPNGITVPAPPLTNGCANVTCPAGRVCEDGRCEIRLQNYFDTNGEAISETANASIDPGVFQPLCDFAATLVLSESGAEAGLAWYNMPASPTAAPATIHQIGPFPMPLGQVITSTDVRSSADYTGGLIGFVLLKRLGNPPAISRVYYSEDDRNALCTNCTMPGYWKMSLTYLSKKLPNSYYLAFEDWEGANDMTWFGNDGDFNDKVFRIDGVICEGGGEPCETAMPGICSQGVTECQVGAGISCKPAIKPTAETCDNLDNDCNGMIDDGSGLCTAGFVCSKGVCIRLCDDSEFPCAVGLRCDTDGLCKDPLCAVMDCPAGKVCQAGVCVGGCDGVVCPLGQRCQLGVCVDPCAGVSCPGAVCEMGACISTCKCRACAAGQVCAMSGPREGHCVDTGCDTMTCPAGTVCRRGSCDDACTGAMCPGRAACQQGMCDAPPPITPTGMGGTSGTGGGGGFIITGRGGTTGAGGSTGGGAGRGGAGGGPMNGTGGGTGGSRGNGGTVACGCAVGDAPAAGGLLLALGAILVAARRRRRG